jgi:hypothetical protein
MRCSAAPFPPRHPPQAFTVEKDHGRREERELWALPVIPEQVGFPFVTQVVRIHRRFTPLNPLPNLATAQPKDESQFYITAIPPLPDCGDNATFLLGVSRGQWSIENGNHYTRDRSYDEDRCQVRHANAAHVLSTLRSLARFLMKIGLHTPKNVYQKSTPSFNRYCNAHRLTAVPWLMAPQSPL